MQTTWSFARTLAIGCLVGGLILAGWMARSSIAKNSPQPQSPGEPPETATQKVEKRKTDSPPTTVTTPAEPRASFADLAPPVEPVLRTDPNGAVVHHPPGNPTLLAPILPSATAPALVDEDPEKVVKVFVEQNKKQAETQLKNLKDEAEKLRTRLQKVEAGIKRWETLLEALKQSQVVASFDPPATPTTAVEPDLVPIRNREPISLPDHPARKARPKTPKPGPDPDDLRPPPG